MKYPATLLALIFSWLAAAGGAFAEWPEHELTLMAPLAPTLPWDQTPNPQAELLASLVPRLSRELGVPVQYVVKPEGQGVLAANAVALAQADGYVLAAIGNDPALNLVIQGYTPYVWEELTPVAAAWRVVHVLVAKNDFPAADLRDLAAAALKAVTQSGRAWDRPRLARLNKGAPYSSAVLMAMEAARAVGFDWDFAEVDRPDPAVLLEGQAEVMALALADFLTHPQKDQFKVLLVLSEEEPFGAQGWPTLRTLGLKLSINSCFVFYLPARVEGKVRDRLSEAINGLLRLQAVTAKIVEIGLLPCLEGPEGVRQAMNREYGNQVKLLESFGLLESFSEAGPMER